MPTEPEWRHAHTARVKTVYINGDTPAALGCYVWFNENSGGTTHSVASKRPNGFGLYDTAGNVAEWTDSSVKTGAASEPLALGNGADAPFHYLKLTQIRHKQHVGTPTLYIGLRVACSLTNM